MIDFYLNYRMTAFIETIEISNANIAKLMGLFLDENLLPNVYNETIINSPNPIQSPTLELRNMQNSWILKFGTGRVDILRIKQSSTSDIGNIEDFVAWANNCLEKILCGFDRKANRIAFATNCVMKELSSDKLDCIYKKIVSPISFYSQNIPFEWSIRNVSKKDLAILDQKENVNFSSILSLAEIVVNENGNIAKSQRVILDFDINSIPDNTALRFSIGHIKSFISTILDYHNSITDEYIKIVSHE
jgi:hypothetical protein